MAIRHRTSVVVIEKNQILGFHAEDPVGGAKYFFLPGGLIEAGETPEAAAIRETLEETGFHIEIIPGKKIVKRYDFKWNGKIHDCETIFFEGKLLSKVGSTVTDASYHRGVGWINSSAAEKTFAYDPHILSAVIEIIRK